MVLLLALAAYLTNLVPLSLSYGLHLLFGGLFSTLAAILYGPVGGGLVAAASSLPTLSLWGHPYAIITLTLEGVAMGFLVKSRRLQHTEADLLYWFLLGMPLVLLTYTLGAKLSLQGAAVAAVKQAVNGLSYTALASVLHLGLVWRKPLQLPLESYLSRIISLLVIGPLVVVVAWSALETGASLRQTAGQEAHQAASALAVRIAQWEREGGDLQQLTAELSEFIPAFQLEMAITDRHDRVFFSNWIGVEVGSSFTPTPGEAPFFNRPPGQEASLGQAERVAFVERFVLPSGWSIYTRKPLVAIETLLQQAYLRRFALSLGLMVLLLGLIRAVAHGVTRPLVNLAAVTVTDEGELVGLATDAGPLRVSEVQAVIDHLHRLGGRVRGLVQELQENQRELERSNVELMVRNVHLANEALRDPLTELLNQRAFWEQMDQWIEENRPFTLILADVEGLAAYAHSRGRAARDGVLEALAQGLQQYGSLHGGEIYRYGPERFACLFPQTGAWVVKRFDLSVHALIELPEPLTIRVGHAVFPVAGPTARQLFAAADQTLAKGGG